MTNFSFISLSFVFSTLKNNQLSNQIKRQKQVNGARQDEIHQLDQQCKKKDEEAISLKRELERLGADIQDKKIKRDRQDLDNQSLCLQNEKKDNTTKETLGTLRRP